MPILDVLRMGHPTLRQPAEEVPESAFESPELRQLVEDMTETMHAVGGIGLAAPQVGKSWRLAIIEMASDQASRYGELPSLPHAVYINPTYEVKDATQAGSWEGCLSVPGLRGYVERPQHIALVYRDLCGNRHEIELRGFAATVFQHEFDHLDGILYVDRVKDSRLLVFEDQLERLLTEK